MLFQWRKDLERRLEHAEDRAKELGDKYWELERRHSQLLAHLGLTERKVLEHTKLEPVKAASA